MKLMETIIMTIPEHKNYAMQVYERIAEAYDLATKEAETSGQSIKLECWTDFGIVTVAFFSACTVADLVRLEVFDHDWKQFLLITDPRRCSFRLSRYSGDPNEKKVIAGFGDEDKRKLQSGGLKLA